MRHRQSLGTGPPRRKRGNGDVYVPDGQNDAIQIFDEDGNWKGQITTDDTFGFQLQYDDIAIDNSGTGTQGRIRTICTRVQWAADKCPKGAIYGRVTAFSPLLDNPLKGNAYLRSSNNQLPDLVFALKGIVDIEASARIDSKEGGIRATFPRIPDAPISKVVVRMQGGQKGLIVNSRNLCLAKNGRSSLSTGSTARPGLKTRRWGEVWEGAEGKAPLATHTRLPAFAQVRLN